MQLFYTPKRYSSYLVRRESPVFRSHKEIGRVRSLVRKASIDNEAIQEEVI